MIYQIPGPSSARLCGRPSATPTTVVETHPVERDLYLGKGVKSRRFEGQVVDNKELSNDLFCMHQEKDYFYEIEGKEGNKEEGAGPSGERQWVIFILIYKFV
jgi:hypothetical protein